MPLDLALFDRIHLSPKPKLQQLIALGFLAPNYAIPPGVYIRFEDIERVPPAPVIFAMNHTDYYNYWPFQYRLWRTTGRMTASWVKGKNYDHPLVAAFMRWTNNIPTISRGYLVTRDFINVMGRRPDQREYEQLRALVDGRAPGKPQDVPSPLLSRARDILGRRFDPRREGYASCINQLFAQMMGRFIELHDTALKKRIDLIVFPQGTRSVRLSRGHIGLAQIALHFGCPIVPVGSNGCDRVYRSKWPIASPGRIVYRFGDPITAEQMAPYAPAEPFVPFSAEAEQRYRPQFQQLVDRVMDRIDGLLDERHRFSDDRESTGLRGPSRFA